MSLKKENSNDNVGYYHSYKYSSLELLHKAGKMHGVRRVAMFCLLTTVLPALLLGVPLYLRHKLYADVFYAVAESDILEIVDGISTVFCSEHTLKMNTSFNAYQVARRPEMTSSRKHIRLKKSMTLPDDTLEYWGFYLLKGATVALSVCSRFQGSSILVVKGERNLRTCGMQEHNTNKAKAKGISLPPGEQQVKVTFETNAQEIYSEEVPQKIPPKAIDLKVPIQNVANGNTIEEVDSRNKISVAKSKDYTKSATVPFDRKEATKSKKRRHTNQQVLNKEGAARNLRLVKTRFHEGKEDDFKEEKRQNNLSHRGSDLEAKEINKRIPRSKRRSFDRDYKSDMERRERVKQLEKELNSESGEEVGDLEGGRRSKRSQESVKPTLLLDRGIKHGGNAVNFTSLDEDSSVSSFENGLLNCYNGHVLLSREFAPYDSCTNVDYLVNGEHMQTTHEVAESGYYYYIFYSDNDFVSNDIHAVFNIYKPTLQYDNVTKACVNETECSFTLGLWSGDRVVVEVPTRNGIEHEKDDITLLISTCHPRMGIYIIFPIAVMFLVLGCAFL